MRVELTDDPAAFRARDWTRLVDADPSGTLFHTPAYLELWWEEFGIGALALALAEEGGRDVGACAFELVDGRLRFLGGFDVTDYMGPVAEVAPEDVAGGLLEAVVALPWSEMDLRGIPEESAWFRALASAAAALGLPVEHAADGVAPMIELDGDFETYLANLPAKLRHELRRKERRLRAETGGYRVALSTARTLAEDMDRFLELHRASPGPKGTFMDRGMEIFFRRLGDAFLAEDRFHLAFVEIGGEKVAGAIGLSHRNTFCLYNSAFDRGFAALSPGTVLVGALIRRATQRGWSRFDMLKGDLDYKYRLGARPRAIGRLVVRR
jgi:CelD/BcsL family acetyltransferase involved in cellulose biosynthesis